VALPGEHTDGHNYIDHAVQNGAVAALVHDERMPGLRKTVFGSVTLFPVDDPLAAFQSLGQAWRKTFPRLTRIGITGSNGKTTTKEMLTSILSLHAATMHTRGNYNSDIGLPMELLRIRDEHSFAVLEMGMNRPGEIKLLASLAEPDYALITNVGSAHVGMIGSREGIAREKKAIFSQFNGNQIAFVPADDEFADFLAEDVPGDVIRYDRETAGITGVELRGIDGTLLHVTEGVVHLRMPGEQMVANAAAAITIARTLSVPFPTIKEGLERVNPIFGRAEVFRSSVTVIQDCYNANPESMSAALSLLAASPVQGKRVAILGAMKELGDQAGPAHSECARRALSLEIDEVMLVGDEFEQAASELDADNVSFFGYSEWERLNEALARIEDGDLVLLKGSRSVALERLTPQLVKREVAT
jgi:UDP-N-acetylmuramoyl-tripeptide--D-alanyl-D-alanine ligase